MKTIQLSACAMLATATANVCNQPTSIYTERDNALTICMDTMSDEELLNVDLDTPISEEMQTIYAELYPGLFA